MAPLEVPSPTVVCLCGSMRFKDQFRAAELAESLRGRVVLLPAFSKADGLRFSDGDIEQLNRVHMVKIDLADEILIIDVDGYVGDQTSSEIRYARSLGKTVRYWSHEAGSSPPVHVERIDPKAMVEECWGRQGATFSDYPTLDVPQEVKELRCAIVEEEAQEFCEAVRADDLVEVADAIADLLYVTYGAALTFGIPIEEVFTEVHRSNMTKVGPNGEVIKRDDGKVLKGPHFEPPAIAPILERHAPIEGTCNNVHVVASLVWARYSIREGAGLVPGRDFEGEPGAC